MDDEQIGLKINLLYKGKEIDFDPSKFRLDLLKLKIEDFNFTIYEDSYGPITSEVSYLLGIFHGVLFSHHSLDSIGMSTVVFDDNVEVVKILMEKILKVCEMVYPKYLTLQMYQYKDLCENGKQFN